MSKQSDSHDSIPSLIELSPTNEKDKEKSKESEQNTSHKEQTKKEEKTKSSTFTITRVQAQKAKDRFNIYVNDEYAFAVDDSLLVNYRLVKGKELTKEEIEELKVKGEMSKAYQAALHYLNYKMRTDKEIRDYLIKKEYQVIEPVIEKLTKNRLINNEEYAKSFVRTSYQLKNDGPKKIERSLYAKGLTKEDVLTGLDEYSMEQQRENAFKAVEKTLRRQRNKSSREIKQKVREQLMKNGFETDVINSVLEEVEIDLPQDEEYEALLKQGEKAWKRYARKYDAYEVKRRTKGYLFSKGYPFDLINQFITEKEEEN